MAEVIQSELKPGTILNGGKYIIEKKIGAGGFGITYMARHSTLDKKFAIKEFFMSGYNVRDNTTNHVSLQGLEVKDFDRIRQNFINEAQTLARLNNVAVVKVIDIFDENGTSYMVMPFVEGVTLQSIVEKNGPMKYEMAVNYIVQICETLTYIHSKSILHRDVTPDNVIVTPDEKIVLIDFGSARKFVNNKTQRQTTIVKPGYAPLEQHSATSRKGAFTDIYSVGAVFYYLLTGKRPMDATERVLEKMKEPIELNPDIPEQINAIIMKAMEMEGSKRYQSAAELIGDIFADDNPNEQGNEKKGNEKNKETKKKEKAGKLKTSKENETEIEIKQEPPFVDNFIPEKTEKEKVVAQKPAKTKKKEKSNGNLLIVFAIVMALIAAGCIIAMLASQSKNNDKQSSLKEPLESSIPPMDDSILDLTSLDSLLNQNANVVINKLLTDQPNDPVLLYSIAMKANKQTKVDGMEEYWNQVLVPEGDVERHLTAQKDKFSLVKFAFICGAKAYENIDTSNYSHAIKQELNVALPAFLDKLRQIDPNVMIYEKHE
jgi:serine/threonine protein kinase